jgi:hypothetical protein
MVLLSSKVPSPRYGPNRKVTFNKNEMEAILGCSMARGKWLIHFSKLAWPWTIIVMEDYGPEKFYDLLFLKGLITS